MKRMLIILFVALVALFTHARFADAQEVDSLVAELRTEATRSRGFIRGAETQLTKVLVLIDSLEAALARDTVAAPPEPPPAGVTVLSVGVNDSIADGNRVVNEGTYFVTLSNPDWLADMDSTGVVAGIDSVVIVLDGVRQKEGRWPFSATGNDPIALTVGLHVVDWEVFGEKAESAQGWTVQVNSLGGNVNFRVPQPMELLLPGTNTPALLVSVDFPLTDVRPLDGYTATLNGEPGTPNPPLGWYWHPAPDDGSLRVIRPDGTSWRATYVKVEADG